MVRTEVLKNVSRSQPSWMDRLVFDCLDLEWLSIVDAAPDTEHDSAPPVDSNSEIAREYAP
jgi:hypothetical protein